MEPAKKLRIVEKRLEYVDLAMAPDSVLEDLVRGATAPDVRELVGWEFRGFNTMDLTALVGIRTFKKGFEADKPPTHARERIRGYNVRTVQNGLAGPWEPVRKDGRPVRHGFYDVYPVDPADRDNLYPAALMLNYGSGRNPLLDPSPFLRDYLVQVYPDNPDLLLGKAYVALGPVRRFMSYFVLERYNRAE